MMGIPVEEEKEKGAGSIFKGIMAENISNLGKEMGIQFHEAQRIPNRLNPNRTTWRHIVIKFPKIN